MPSKGLPALLRQVTWILLSAPLVQANLWHISIDESPAPSPEDGPPFSAHASRDRALLPAQICGIVAAYLGSILILGSLLLTLGRRLRSAAQSSQSTLAMEMVKPTTRAFEGSPISPASTQQSWYSPRRLKKKPSASNSFRSVSNPGSPGQDSVASFDAKVIEADKAARQQEMERLYAAVMARDDNGVEILQDSTEAGLHRMDALRADRKALRVVTTSPALQHLQNRRNPSNPNSPASPQSPVRAIYPPDSPIRPFPQSPTSPIRTEYPRRTSAPYYAAGLAGYPTAAETNNRVSRASSQASQTSSVSRPRRLRKSLRNIKISAPVLKHREPDDSDSARTPLSPRYYPDPGPPPSPPRSESSTTPDYHHSKREPIEAYEELDRIRDLPRTAPQRMSSHGYNNWQNGMTDVKDYGVARSTATVSEVTTGRAVDQPRFSPDGQSVRTPASNPSNTNSRGLPFRALQNTQLSESLHSPGRPTKTTHLERRRDLLAIGGPRTGAMTPYSPYMPFTPVTPVTPHLTSKRERRQREKEKGRRVLGQEDAVIDEDEMWGNAY